MKAAMFMVKKVGIEHQRDANMQTCDEESSG
jgi:hypothetical protein